LSDSAWEQLKGYPKPKLLISGDYDSVIPRQKFEQYVEDIPEPKQFQVIPGADHFWRGYEEEVAGRVAGFFATDFNPLDTQPC